MAGVGRFWCVALLVVIPVLGSTCAAQESESLFAPILNWGQLETPPEPWSLDGTTPFIQRFGAGYRLGDGLGFDKGFTDVEWMIPIKVDDSFDILFGEAHMLIHDDGQIGANFNLAYRVYNTSDNRIYGVYGFFDYTPTRLNMFGQIGLGVESLGPILDFRGNVYIPDLYGIRGSLPNEFVGHNMIVNRADVAMTGGDLEMGLNLPEVLNVRSRVYGGGYYFNGHGNGNATGWKVRGEAELNRSAWVDVRLQDDNLFGRTLSVGMTFRYSHRFLGHQPATETMDHKFFRTRGVNYSGDISDRLTDPIARVQNILRVRDSGEIATDTLGNPINFLHVANGGVGPGTIESPYGSLTAALADGDAATSVIYTPFGGTFVEDVTLIDGATVLSNGPVQTVATQYGNQQLPYSGSSVDLSNLPTITGNVTLANNVLFSGFDITGAMTATAVNGFTIENSVVTNPIGDAVTVTSVDTGTFENLRLSSGAGRGMLIDDSAPALTDITVVSATDDGIEVHTGASNREISTSNLTVQSAGAIGLDLIVMGAGNLTFTTSGTTSLTATGNAFNAALAGGSTGNLILALNSVTMASSAGAGANLDGTAGAGTLFVTSFRDNAVTTAATGGILVDTVTFDSNLIAGGFQQVAGNTLTIGNSADTTDVLGDGLRLIDPTGNLGFGNINIYNDSDTGLLVDTKGGGTTFALANTGGTIMTTNGPAMNLDPLAISMQFDTLRSDNSPTNGIVLDTVSGGLGATTTILNGSIGTPIVISNTPAQFNVNLGNTTIQSTISNQQADNVDTTLGNGMNLNLQFNSLSITGP